MRNKVLLLSFVCYFFVGIAVCTLLYYRNASVLMTEVSSYSREQLMADIIITEDETSYHLTGWCMKPGEDTGLFDMKVLLYNREKEQYYRINTASKPNPKVSAMMKDGYCYDNSGLEARVLKAKLPDAGIPYTICILYECNQNHILYDTGLTLS